MHFLSQSETHAFTIEESSLPAIYEQYGCDYMIIKDPSFPFIYTGFLMGPSTPEWFRIDTTTMQHLTGKNLGILQAALPQRQNLSNQCVRDITFCHFGARRLDNTFLRCNAA